MVMLNGLNQHLQVNKIFVPEQFNFRKGVTIPHAISTLANSILHALNKQQKAGEILYDQPKAFDCISYNILINKLNHYEVHGTNLKRFQSYLTERKHTVDTSSSNNQGTP